MAKLVTPVKTGRPIMPEGYIPEKGGTLLPWTYVDERMLKALNYWIITASAGGKPAASPVWGAWIDGKLYFDGAPSTRRGRNISANANTTVHLESGDEVVILDGEALIFNAAPERALAERIAAQYREKYAARGYSPEPTQWDEGGLFVFTPKTAVGWTKFPDDTTRWVLKE